MASSWSHGNTQPEPRIGGEIGHVHVAQAEYDHLVQTARRYDNLCRSLLAGGIDHETINILSNVQIDKQPASLSDPDSDADRPAVHVSHTSRSTHQGHRLDPAQPSFAASFSQRDSASPSMNKQARYEVLGVGPGSRTNGNSEGPCSTTNGRNERKEHERPTLDREAMRTLQFSNLPEGVTHADITAIVRGGQLFDVYLRRKNSTATVSFVYGMDAQAYYDHVRKHDLYIGNRKVQLSWNERQFPLPGHVANKVLSGVTRNFVIRRCDPSLTEESIREDLDHIHNLIVVKVEFIGDSCFVSTNSISCASFARSCMISRIKYRGSRIEWDKDECAQSLDRMPARKQMAVVNAPMPPRRPFVPQANRFQLLNLDQDDDTGDTVDGEDEGDADDDDVSE